MSGGQRQGSACAKKCGVRTQTYSAPRQPGKSNAQGTFLSIEETRSLELFAEQKANILFFFFFLINIFIRKSSIKKTKKHW